MFPRTRFLNCWLTFLPSRTRHSLQKSSLALRTVYTYRVQITMSLMWRCWGKYLLLRPTVLPKLHGGIKTRVDYSETPVTAVVHTTTHRFTPSRTFERRASCVATVLFPIPRMMVFGMIQWSRGSNSIMTGLSNRSKTRFLTDRSDVSFCARPTVTIQDLHACDRSIDSHTLSDSLP